MVPNSLGTLPSPVLQIPLLQPVEAWREWSSPDLKEP